MTKEEKQLLLTDLCARLPHGVNLHIEFYDLQGDGKLTSRDIKLAPGNIAYCFDNSHWVSVKPYLRPMSSMTEEEKEDIKHRWCYNDWDIDGPSSLWREKIDVEDAEGIIDYFNEHHFDFRGLIPMGLALEAPEDMYKQ